MVTNVFRVPADLCAILSQEDGDEEIPILGLALHDNGELTLCAWSEKQNRVGEDVSDELFFPGFAGIGFMAPDDEEEEEDEPDDEIEELK